MSGNVQDQPPFALKFASSGLGIWFFGPTGVRILNGITIRSAVFAGLTVVAARQTDRPHYSISSNRPHLASAAMRPNNTDA